MPEDIVSEIRRLVGFAYADLIDETYTIGSEHIGKTYRVGSDDGLSISAVGDYGRVRISITQTGFKAEIRHEEIGTTSGVGPTPKQAMAEARKEFLAALRQSEQEET